MMLLRGDAAVSANLKRIGTVPLCTVVLDPKAGPEVAPRFAALAWGQEVILVDMLHTPGLSELFDSPMPFAAGDAKRAHRGLMAAGMVAPARWACASVCGQLLDWAQTPRDLKALHDNSAQSQSWTGLDSAAHRFDMTMPDVQRGFTALCDHAQALSHLVQRQSEALLRLDMRAVSRLEAAAVAPIGEMEARGMPFQSSRWHQLAQLDAAEHANLAAWLQQAVGHPHLDVTDDARLLRALARIGQRPASARGEDLAQLAAPWGPNLLRLRKLNKRIQAFGLAFLEHAGPDGRIHPTFAQIGASTGRMACHAPNLQAITKEGGRRTCFHVKPDHCLVIADYRACELRILAHLSEDAAFIAAFHRGADVHAEVATRIFGRAGSQKDGMRQREVAKVVSFGLIYGMGPRGLAGTLGIDVHQAKKLQTQYFSTFPRVKDYLMDAEATAARRGYAVTLAGRRLWLPQPNASQLSAPDHGVNRRVARNMPIQGTSADIIKLALARLRRRWGQKSTTGVVNCVHDEIIVECPKDSAQKVAQYLTQGMVDAARSFIYRVPMAVNLRISASWQAPTDEQ